MLRTKIGCESDQSPYDAVLERVFASKSINARMDPQENDSQVEVLFPEKDVTKEFDDDSHTPILDEIRDRQATERTW
ncbi:hypothetical protein ACTXT7_013463 [Hymenolepis weldensis]